MEGEGCSVPRPGWSEYLSHCFGSQDPPIFSVRWRTRAAGIFGIVSRDPARWRALAARLPGRGRGRSNWAAASTARRTRGPAAASGASHSSPGGDRSSLSKSPDQGSHEHTAQQREARLERGTRQALQREGCGGPPQALGKRTAAEGAERGREGPAGGKGEQKDGQQDGDQPLQPTSTRNFWVTTGLLVAQLSLRASSGQDPPATGLRWFRGSISGAEGFSDAPAELEAANASKPPL